MECLSLKKLSLWLKNNYFILIYFIIYFGRNCNSNELKPVVFPKDQDFLITHTNDRQETNPTLTLAIMKVPKK